MLKVSAYPSTYDLSLPQLVVPVELKVKKVGSIEVRKQCSAQASLSFNVSTQITRSKVVPTPSQM